ncbi:MAG: histidine phosphatase family protein [Verrucomicrobiota bacterium]
MKALLLLLFANALTAFGQPAQIILLRHAEKPDDPAALHLSARGEERARALVSLLGTNSTLTSNAPIVALYATRVTAHDHGQRTGETLAPLAKELGLPVQAPYESEHFSSLAHDILTNGNLRSNTVVICWTHHTLADLASAFGVKPKPAPWKENTFDRLWIIKPGDTKTVLKDTPQHLLKHDAKR